MDTRGSNSLPTASAPPAADIPLSHWSLLFDAVQKRLHRVLEDPFGLQRASGSQAIPADFKTVVAECAQALNQLHASLSIELQRCSSLEHELAAAHAALAEARGRLVTTEFTERRAVHRSQHDELTQLANRMHFRERLAATLGAATPGLALAVLYIDLDDFKRVNDLYGHATGDALLRIVGARLADSAHAGDLIGRIGGDEFAYLSASRAERATLVELVRHLVQTLSAPVEIGNLRLSVKPSIGVSVCPEDGQTGDRLLEQADAAMYHAKRSGVGYAFVDDCRTR